MSSYPIGLPIPLYYVRTRQGQFISGLSVTVTVLNLLTGTTLVPSTPLAETSPGVYAMLWETPPVSQTHCIEIYEVNGIRTILNEFDILSSGATEEYKLLISLIAAANASAIEATVLDDNIEAIVLDDSITAWVQDDMTTGLVTDGDVKVKIDDGDVRGKIADDNIIYQQKDC